MSRRSGRLADLRGTAIDPVVSKEKTLRRNRPNVPVVPITPDPVTTARLPRLSRRLGVTELVGRPSARTIANREARKAQQRVASKRFYDTNKHAILSYIIRRRALKYGTVPQHGALTTHNVPVEAINAIREEINKPVIRYTDAHTLLPLRPRTEIGRDLANLSNRDKWSDDHVINYDIRRDNSVVLNESIVESTTAKYNGPAIPITIQDVYTAFQNHKQPAGSSRDDWSDNTKKQYADRFRLAIQKATNKTMKEVYAMDDIVPIVKDFDKLAAALLEEDRKGKTVSEASTKDYLSPISNAFQVVPNLLLQLGIQIRNLYRDGWKASKTIQELKTARAVDENEYIPIGVLRVAADEVDAYAWDPEHTEVPLYGDAHLITLMYTTDPYRDNLGDVLMVYKDKDIPPQDQLSTVFPKKKQNYYNAARGQLVLRHYKTVGIYREKTIQLSDEIRALIRGRIGAFKERFPKSSLKKPMWLFSQMNNPEKPLKLLSGYVPKSFLLAHDISRKFFNDIRPTINLIRHSWVAGLYNKEYTDEDAKTLADRMHHSTTTAIYTYNRKNSDNNVSALELYEALATFRKDNKYPDEKGQKALGLSSNGKKQGQKRKTPDRPAPVAAKRKRLVRKSR